jgi:hypothetical protein
MPVRRTFRKKFTRRVQDFFSGVGTDTTHFTKQLVVISHTSDYPDAYLQPAHQGHIIFRRFFLKKMCLNV